MTRQKFPIMCVSSMCVFGFKAMESKKQRALLVTKVIKNTIKECIGSESIIRDMLVKEEKSTLIFHNVSGVHIDVF